MPEPEQMSTSPADDERPDSGSRVDGEQTGAGPPDLGLPDAGPQDAGPPDAGPQDAGPPDAGPQDAGPPDAGPLDAGSLDYGQTDSADTAIAETTQAEQTGVDATDDEADAGAMAAHESAPEVEATEAGDSQPGASLPVPPPGEGERAAVLSSSGVPSDDRRRAIRRLRQVVTGAPSGAQLLIAILVALLGFAAVTQLRINSHDDNFVGERGQDLVVILDSLTQSNDRLRTQLEDLQREQGTLTSRRSQRLTAMQKAQSRLSALGILAGSVAAQGPGVRITISASSGTIRASTILDAIEELRDAGAEAMEINDEVRIVASTAITDSNGVVYVDGVALKTPYVIDAIGSAHTLEQAVTFRGGLTEQVQNNDGKVAVVASDDVKVTSLHKVEAPQYSRPAG